MKDLILSIIILILVNAGVFFISSYLDSSGEIVDLKYGDSINLSGYDSFDTSKSSFIEGAWYLNRTEHLILDLGTSNYEYCDVPKKIWNSFKNAESLGSYYNSNIKNVYSCN
jgi:hypothetical protein